MFSTSSSKDVCNTQSAGAATDPFTDEPHTQQGSLCMSASERKVRLDLAMLPVWSRLSNALRSRRKSSANRDFLKNFRSQKLPNNDYNCMIWAVDPQPEREELVAASCYPDNGCQTERYGFAVDGREIIPDGLIQRGFVQKWLSHLDIQSMPESVELEAACGVLRVTGWVSLQWFGLKETGLVTFPRRRSSMVCLIIEEDDDLHDVLIGTTGITKWRLFRSGRKFWMFKNLRKSHKPEPSKSVMNTMLLPMLTNSIETVRDDALNQNAKKMRDNDADKASLLAKGASNQCRNDESRAPDTTSNA
jgi:hypothetical protein